MGQKLKNILIFVAVLYGVWLLDLILVGYDLTQWGLRPRTLTGLIGIFTAPLLHGNLYHLVSNTVPLVILLFLTVQFYPKKSPAVISIIVVLGGLLVWIFARGAVHVGASGLIFGLAAFLIVHGFLTRDVKNLLLSLLVLVVYGGMFWGVFPSARWNISWEGHLFGAVSGALSGYIFRNIKSE